MRKLVLGLLFIALLPLKAVAGDEIVEFSPDNPTMNAAIEEALTTLPTFLENTFVGAGAVPAATLKVAMPYGNDQSVEIIWVDSLIRQGEGYTGQLANNPFYLEGLSLGDRVEFSKAQIRDWGYMDAQSGKLFGNYTTRVVVETLPAAQQMQIKQMLGNPPVPGNW